jgi:hypothetical protein
VKDALNDVMGFGTVSWDDDEPDTRH